jgi:LAO/AO transport system kinase
VTTIPALGRNARLLADFDAGQKGPLARVVSVVENHRPGFDRVLATLHARVGQARRIGSGTTGAWKSTLTVHLARAYRDAGSRWGSSPSIRRRRSPAARCSATAFRMEAVALDPGVFIRSMATRGSLGGLAAATREVADVLDAFGLDRILIETVGVGQSELDIARTADTSVVVPCRSRAIRSRRSRPG